MNKIKHLTPEQAALLPLWREEWLRVGLSTEPADFERAEIIISDFYKIIGKSKPKFIHTTSPMMAELLINSFNNEKWGKDLFGNLDRSAQLYAQLIAQLRDQLIAQLRTQLSDQLASQCGAQLRAQLSAQKLTYNGAWFWGNQECWWIAFYLFCHEIGAKYKRENLDLLNKWAELSKSVGWIYPYDKVVILCDRPERIHWNNGRLHNPNGMAIKFRDGFGFHSLNGIRVPAWLVETPIEDLDVKKIFAEQNIDIRREGLRRIPMERLIRDTNAKILDEWKDPSKEWCDYTLYDMDFGDGKIRRVLRMKNPSIDAQHFERVEDDITTVKSALAWRMGVPKYIEPIILT